MNRQKVIWRALVVLLLVFAAAGAGFWFRDDIARVARILMDRDRTGAFIQSFGPAAPLAFMGVQFLQVVFAPVPGEATGFIGGYLFGPWKGFAYSTIALTAGSILNFFIGRLFGEKVIRRMLPEKTLTRIDGAMRGRGVLVAFFLFLFPGFPKDYLCLFLGMSPVPFPLFVFISGVGRMPGTFLLSLQGAALFERSWVVLGVSAGFCVALVVLMWRFRDAVQRFLARFDKGAMR